MSGAYGLTSVTLPPVLSLHSGKLFEPLKDDSYSRLTHGIRKQISRQCVDKLCRTQEPVDFTANVRTECNRFCPNLGDEGRSAIDHGDEIFQIATSEPIPLPATFKRIELRGDKKRGRNHADLKII